MENNIVDLNMAEFMTEFRKDLDSAFELILDDIACDSIGKLEKLRESKDKQDIFLVELSKIIRKPVLKNVFGVRE